MSKNREEIKPTGEDLDSVEFEAYLDYHKQSQDFIDHTEAEPSQLLNIQTVNNPSVSDKGVDPEDAEQIGNLINKIVTFNEQQDLSRDSKDIKLDPEDDGKFHPWLSDDYKKFYTYKELNPDDG